MDFDFFHRKLNASFEIHFGPGYDHKAILTEVNKLSDVPGQKRSPFSLIFLTDLKDQYFGQGIFSVKTADAEAMSIFLVPIGKDHSTGQIQYQAIFN